jgi:ankyrin repeat protein
MMKDAIQSTVTLRDAYSTAAFTAIMNNIALQTASKKGFTDCTNLNQALDALGMSYELRNDSITNIRYSGGCWGDPSTLLWETLAPFVEAGSRWQRENDAGEVTMVNFEGGKTFLEVGLSPEAAKFKEQGIEPEERIFHALDNGSGDIRQIIDSTLATVGHLNFRDYDGNTPFMIACREASYSQWHFETAMELLPHEHDLHTVNEYDETPLQLAIGSEQDALVRAILSRAPVSKETLKETIEVVAQSVSLPMIKLLAEYGLSPAQTNALFLACMSPTPKQGARKPLVEYLVEKADCNINQPTSTPGCIFGTPVFEPGATPLMAAVFNGEYDLVEYLLTRGASALTADSQGTTALHYLCGPLWKIREGTLGWSPRKDASLTARLLLQAGLLPDSKNLKGISSRDLAKKYCPELLEDFAAPR